jgi:hypothetical protein
VVDAFPRHFPAERPANRTAPASEDFGSFGTEWHADDHYQHP